MNSLCHEDIPTKFKKGRQKLRFEQNKTKQNKQWIKLAYINSCPSCPAQMWNDNTATNWVFFIQFITMWPPFMPDDGWICQVWLS